MQQPARRGHAGCVSLWAGGGCARLGCRQAWQQLEMEGCRVVQGLRRAKVAACRKPLPVSRASYTNSAQVPSSTIHHPCAQPPLPCSPCPTACSLSIAPLRPISMRCATPGSKQIPTAPKRLHPPSTIHVRNLHSPAVRARPPAC